MSGVELDWSSAEVRDGKLEVGLRGELPRGWKDSFERTVALLPGGDWDKVRLKKDRVRVHHVVPGSEDQLRHYLESVVVQANAVHEPAETETPEDQDAEPDEPNSVDAELTQRFRAFGSEEG